MSTEESAIYEFLKRFRNRFVSVTDISKSVGARKDFIANRLWAQPILRRMELEGWVEASPFGEYRVKASSEDSTTFKKALETPFVDLGDTTIISIGDVKEDQADAA
jgi:hypothetical protein